MTSSRLIPAEIVYRLVEGSYESFIGRVQDLVEAHREAIYGPDSDGIRFAVQGTYPNHAVVVSESPELPVVRVHFEAAKDGVLRFVKHEAIRVPTFDASNVDDFVQVEARKAVDDLLAGNTTNLLGRMRQMLPFVQAAAASTDADVVARVDAALESKGAWKTALDQQAKSVRDLLGEALVAADRSKLTPKFSSLHTASAADSESHRAHVQAEMVVLTKRLDGVEAAVAQALSAVHGRLPEVRAKVSAESLKTFSTVAESLLRDLRSVRKVAKDAARLVESVSHLARAYDGLAASLFDYEIAGLFVAKLAQRIAQGSR